MNDIRQHFFCADTTAGSPKTDVSLGATLLNICITRGNVILFSIRKNTERVLPTAGRPNSVNRRSRQSRPIRNSQCPGSSPGTTKQDKGLAQASPILFLTSINRGPPQTERRGDLRRETAAHPRSGRTHPIRVSRRTGMGYGDHQSPKLVPTPRALATQGWSGGTVLT